MLITQQNNQGAFASVDRFGLAVGQDFLTLNQPVTRQYAQHRHLTR